MSALDVITRIISNTNLFNADFKYCLVDSEKHPFTYKNELCRPNYDEDFVTLDILTNNIEISKYEGVGISIHANNICAIDIDECAKEKFNEKSLDERALSIINLFKDKAYIEFSFSGKGVRILFNTEIDNDYADKYYIKNSYNKIEFYSPVFKARYVTLTGNYIYNNNPFNKVDKKTLNEFLVKWMKRKIVRKSENEEIIKDDRSIDDLLKLVKFFYFKNSYFQDLRFDRAPGKGHNESERDFALVKFIYVNITKDKEKILKLFMESPFYKSKDSAHNYKRNKNDFEYFNDIYNKVRSTN